MQTNRAFSIKERAEQAIRAINDVSENPIYHAFRPVSTLLNQVEGMIKPIAQSDDVRSSVAAIQWCFDHGLIQQAYTLARELIISTVCWVEKKDPKNRNHRRNVEGWLNRLVKHDELKDGGTMSNDQTETCGQNQKSPGEKEVIAAEKLGQFPDLLRYFKEFSNLRHDLNHAAARTNPRNPEDFTEFFQTHWPALKQELLRYWDMYRPEKG